MGLPNNWTVETVVKLTLIKGLTYSFIKETVERFDCYEDLLEKAPERLLGKNSTLSFFSDNSIETEHLENLENISNNNIKTVTYWDDNYPPNLRQLEHAPVVLYYKGSLQDNESNCISIVGTRRCSVYGRLSAERFASEICSAGLVVVSGLAYGVDSYAHQSVLKSEGVTYAVIASGLDCISPASSEKLANEIADKGGAIISEYRCGVKAKPGYFPQRNRIISGISKAVIVIESDIKGGSMITARFAIDQSREVFALPGPVNSRKSAGCNKLIHDNIATVALSPKSVLEDLGIVNSLQFDDDKPTIKFSSEKDKLLFQAISNEPIHIDSLPEITNLEISEILVKLLEFEFKGLVRQLPGKYYIIN